MRLCGFADEADSFLSGQIKALRRNGMKLLEIRGVDGENISVIKTEKLKAIKKELDEAGISVWSIGSPIGKTDPCVDFDGQIEKKEIGEEEYLLKVFESGIIFKRLLESSTKGGVTCIKM